ncbi:Cj0814 family flagellar-dependent secreted protein [Campylobacter concisus]|uniref:Cj0814 family flagellar-dependent secreted protein n=1 Tax=Campylobacter concisus TaxID=199 RepID=UPI003D1F20C3
MLNGLNNNTYTQSYKASINSRQAASLSTATNQTSSLVLGYKIDKDGYFTDEFNKQAGIPSGYKIHSSTLESLVRIETQPDYMQRAFDSIDILKTVNNAYKILSQVVGEDTLNSKDSFSLDEIRNFPQGFSYNRQSMQVTKIHNSIHEFGSAAADFNGKESNKQMISTLFFNPSFDGGDGRQPLKPTTDIFNNNNGGKENTVIGIFMDPHGEKYTNKDGSITKGGLIAAVINNNLDVREGETTARGKREGYDKSIDSKEFNRAFELFELMGEMKFGANFNKASDSDLAGMPEYMQEYVKYKRDLVYVDLTTGFVGKYSDEEDELSFKKMMEHNLKMLKLLFGEIDKDGKKSKDFMDSFLKFSMPPLNLVKELNENPAEKYLVDMLGIKRDIDIKA